MEELMKIIDGFEDVEIELNDNLEYEHRKVGLCKMCLKNNCGTEKCPQYFIIH